MATLLSNLSTRGIRGAIVLVLCLGQALPLPRRLDLSLPAVAAGDGPDRLHAGRQAPLDEGDRDPLCVLLGADGRQHLEVVGHDRPSVR